MGDENIRLGVSATDGASSVLKGVQANLEGFTGSLFKQGTAAVALGGIIKDVLVKSLGALKDIVVSGISDAIQAEATEAKLSQALKASRQEVDQNMASLKRLANQMAATTTFTGEATLKAASLGIQFGLTAQQAERLIPAIADMSAGLGIDLETAMRMAAKGAEGSDSALKKFGITLKGTGTEAEQFDDILKQLNDRFGGQAQAMAETTKGTLENLGKAFNDVKEAIGTVIIQSPIFKAAMDTVHGAISWVYGLLTQQDVWDNFVYNMEQAARKAKGLSYEFKGLVTETSEQDKMLASLTASQEKATQTAVKDINIKELSNSKFRQLIKSSELFIALSDSQVKAVEERIKADQLATDLKEKDIDNTLKAIASTKTWNEGEEKAFNERLAQMKKFRDARQEIADMPLKIETSSAKAALAQITQGLGETIAALILFNDTQSENNKTNAAEKNLEMDRLDVWYTEQIALAGNNAAQITAIEDEKKRRISEINLAWDNKIAVDKLAADEKIYNSTVTFKDKFVDIWGAIGRAIISIVAQMIAKLLLLKAFTMLFNAVSGVGFLGNVAMGAMTALSGQTHEGELRGIPGPPRMPVPLIAHGQEILGRPGGGLGGGNVIVQGDVYGWDEAVERIRMGLVNHERLTGASVLA